MGNIFTTDIFVRNLIPEQIGCTEAICYGDPT